MRVFRNLTEVVPLKNCVLTTGTFDGVHLGHRTIIKNLIESAKNRKGESLIITFDPHPRIVLQQSTDLKLLSTLDEKVDLLEQQGVDNLLIIPFTKEFSRLSSLEFVREILVNKINTKKLIIGYDHHFGRNREGSFEHLMEFGPLYGFDVEEIPVKDVNDVNVSSTKIREAIENGAIELANSFLGHAYCLTGLVIKGNQIGRTLGFPTANLQIENSYKLIPKVGVYAVKSFVFSSGKTYNGMLNVGYRPTINQNLKLSIEVNLFDFNNDIYGEKIKVEVISKIRDEIEFESLDLLKAQLIKDKKRCLELLSN